MLNLNSPSGFSVLNIYCSSGLTFSHHSFIQRCQGKLDFMKADGIDERILKHTKKGRRLRCLLMLTLSVTSLLRASLFQSDRGREEKMTLSMAVI